MYTIQNDEILRNGVAIASVNGDTLDFYEGKARFRAPAVKFFNQQKGIADETEDTESVEVADTPVESEKKEEKVEAEKWWLDVLSDIVGVKLPVPHPKQGWRGTNLRPLLLKHYNDIVDSKDIDNSVKKQIINYFM